MEGCLPRTNPWLMSARTSSHDLLALVLVLCCGCATTRVDRTPAARSKAAARGGTTGSASRDNDKHLDRTSGEAQAPATDKPSAPEMKPGEKPGAADAGNQKENPPRPD